MKWALISLGTSAEFSMLGFIWLWRPVWWQGLIFLALWCVSNGARKAQTVRHASENGGHDG